jgi:hypothetical protein
MSRSSRAFYGAFGALFARVLCVAANMKFFSEMDDNPQSFGYTNAPDGKGICRTVDGLSLGRKILTRTSSVIPVNQDQIGYSGK